MVKAIFTLTNNEIWSADMWLVQYTAIPLTLF